MWGIDVSRNQGSGNRGNLVEVVPRRWGEAWGEQRDVGEEERGSSRAGRAGTSCGERAGRGPMSLQSDGEVGECLEMETPVLRDTVWDVNPSDKLQSTRIMNAFSGLSSAKQRDP